MIVCLISAFYHAYQCVKSIKHNEPSLLPFSVYKDIKKILNLWFRKKIYWISSKMRINIVGVIFSEYFLITYLLIILITTYKKIGVHSKSY